MEATLTTPIQFLPRVGPVMAEKLNNLSIQTIQDLLFYAPFRYNDYSLVSPINRIRAGETVTVRATVESIKNVYTKTGKKMQQAKISDISGNINVIWFNQPFLTKTIHSGDIINLAGKADWFGRELVLISPEYEIIDSNQITSLHTGRLVPVYPETAGISSKWLRGRINHVLEALLKTLEEPLPIEILQKFSLLNIQEAIQKIHFPQKLADVTLAKHRLGFNELLYLQLSSRLLRQEREAKLKSHIFTINPEDVLSFISSLPFQLTADQKKSVDELIYDLTKHYPANRLLIGDVGSGKTVIAAIGMYLTFRNGLNSLLMAPTEILAQQHYQTINNFLSPLGIKVGLVTGSNKIDESLKYNVLVGTHALLTDTTKLDNIGLVVIDEQHRFGVRQRALLADINQKGKLPHLLTMTATPIPRTIALSALGNLDVSFLNEMPGGRLKTKTWVVPTQKHQDAYDWIKKQINQTNGQAFIIYPLIEESENMLSVKAATKEFERLQKKVFPEFKLGLLHGRLKPNEKQQILDQFRKNQIQILIATPVVEVGIDIPNATIMLIESAERFGLGQLHQLRGRVGRGILQSFCLLFTESDEPKTLERLTAMEKFSSGPSLAEIDLKLRGPGELFGLKQHGLPTFKFADLFDQNLVTDVQKAATTLISNHPNLTDLPLLRKNLEEGIIKQYGTTS